MRSRVCFLRLSPCPTQKLLSRTIKEFIKFYRTPWQSLNITKPTRKTNSVYFINPPTKDYSTIKSPRPPREEKQCNEIIMSLKTVEDELELFANVKNSAFIVNRVTMLYNIAKIVERDQKQKQVLDQEKEKSQQGQSSAYMELLESISRDISKCQSRHLANVMWALGKIEEKDHKLVEVCEKEILSRDISIFNNADICQIVHGCANLNLTTSGIFGKLKEAILNQGQVHIRDFDNQLLSAVLLSFAKTDNGSDELFEVFLEEILSRDFLKVDTRALAAFVWSFAKKEFISDKLFKRVEEEILRRETTDLKGGEFIQLLRGFSTVERGNNVLFNFLDRELVLRGVERFDNAALLEIVWCFGKRKVTKAKVFDLVRKELFFRGVHKFQIHELVLILFSFVSAQRHDGKLVDKIEGELCLRDLELFDNGLLCQVAWSLGRAGKSDGKLFDVIEAEVFRRGECEFTMLQKYMLMWGFIAAERGSKEFYELLVGSISASELCNLHGREICECVWCFYKAGVEAGTLFDALEKEILSKQKNYFSQKQVVFIKKMFTKLEKGSKELFEL